MVRYLPMASKLSSGRPNGSIKAWQPAQAGLWRCASRRCRLVVGLLGSRSGKTRATPSGGGGTTLHISHSRMNFPRSVGDPAFWLANCERNPALLKMPTRALSAGSETVLK